jgi:hypothetical protein
MAQRVICLPIYPTLGFDDVDRVVDVIRAAGLRGSSSRTPASSVPVPRRNADPAGDVSESSRGKRLAALAEPVGSA